MGPSPAADCTVISIGETSAVADGGTGGAAIHARPILDEAASLLTGIQAEVCLPRAQRARVLNVTLSKTGRH